MTRFIDRSNVNGPASADDLKRAAITHLYAKASEGLSFTDLTYQDRHAAAAAAGAKFGGYHFAGHSSAPAEADFFLSRIGKPPAGSLRPCLDLESGQSAAWAEAFALRVKAKLGYLPVLYGSTSFIAPLRAANATLKACPWWRAEYGPNDGQVHQLEGGDQGAAAHQYTSVATFPGISGHTDASILIDEAALLVPGPKTPPRGWVVKWTRKDGTRGETRTLHPVRWHIRNPRCTSRGSLIFERPPKE